MTVSAHSLSSSLMFVGETTFTLYLLLSFIAVVRYATRKISTGRLINGRAAPHSLSIPPSGVWLFNFNVVAILFVQSTTYVILALAAIILFLSADGRMGQDRHSLNRAGAWLFIANVMALLFTGSPYYMLLIVIGQAVLLLENNRTAEEQFGFSRLSGRQLLSWSIIISGAVVVVASPVLDLFEMTLDALHFSHPQQQSVEDFRQVHQAARLIDFLIQAIFLAPLIEELFFRGFLLTFLKTYMSTWVALILSAGIFAVAHQNLDSVLALWILGIVLGVAYEHTGSILLPMGIHACFNLTTGLTLLAQRVGS
jgi:membrane protease YdiL (CAAX protease family)